MARKRDRVANAADSRKRRKVDAVSKLANRVFNPDQLDWKPVALPDGLQDAEGFYGLEEIEDVDIVPSHGQGDVKFKVGWMTPHIQLGRRHTDKEISLY